MIASVSKFGIQPKNQKMKECFIHNKFLSLQCSAETKQELKVRAFHNLDRPVQICYANKTFDQFCIDNGSTQIVCAFSQKIVHSCKALILYKLLPPYKSFRFADQI